MLETFYKQQVPGLGVDRRASQPLLELKGSTSAAFRSVSTDFLFRGRRAREREGKKSVLALRRKGWNLPLLGSKRGQREVEEEFTFARICRPPCRLWVLFDRSRVSTCSARFVCYLTFRPLLKEMSSVLSFLRRSSRKERSMCSCEIITVCYVRSDRAAASYVCISRNFVLWMLFPLPSCKIASPPFSAGGICFSLQRLTGKSRRRPSCERNCRNLSARNEMHSSHPYAL